MLSILNKIKTATISLIRIVTLQDFRPYFSKKQYSKVAAFITISVLNSLLRLLTPLLFGKAVESMAKSESDVTIFQVKLSTLQLMISFVLLSIWLQGENQLKKLLFDDVENVVVKELFIRLSKMVHQIDIGTHSRMRNEINKSFYSLQNACSQLNREVNFSIYPAIFDILIGGSYIWYKYQKEPGLIFIFYALSDVFIINQLLMWLLKLTERNALLSEQNHQTLNHEFEMLMYEETVRIYHHEQYETDLTERQVDHFLVTKRKTNLAESIYSLLSMTPLCVANLFLVIYLSDRKSLDNIDDTIFLITYFLTFATYIRRFNHSYKSCLEAIEKFNQIANILKLQSNSDTLNRVEFPSLESKSLIPSIGSPSSPLNFHLQPYLAIEFDNVSFYYHESSPILRNVSFIIQAGKFVGIVGKSGVGKSTIAKLLYRFYTPQAGVIKINGIDIEHISLNHLRSMLAYVPQSTDLFNEESVQYNVLYGSKDEELLLNLKEATNQHENELNSDMSETSAEHLPFFRNSKRVFNSALFSTDKDTTLKRANKIFKNVMEQVQLSELIEEKKDAYQKKTHLLSGGQKQRLGIARALIRNSSIVIFDESTSNLDSFTESEILKHINKNTRDKTAIMISHRLATVKNADEILVLDQGEIVEHGTHENLIAKQGTYYDYWRLQTLQ